MKSIEFSHCAVLVPSVTLAANSLTPHGFSIGPPEKFEGEGTLEIYVGDPTTRSGTLLLMEAIGEGAYLHALKKRGPGLHHLAINCLDLSQFLKSIESSGWLLHPRSARYLARGTAYLCRPGVPALIEVQEVSEFKAAESFIKEIKIPGLSKSQLQMFAAIGMSQVKTGARLELVVQSVIIPFSQLIVP